MAEYRLFNGGNGKLFYKPVPIRDATAQSGYTTYASSIKRSAFVIPFHFDWGNEDWKLWAGDKGIANIVTGDVVVSHYLASGSAVSRIAILNRMAAPAGTTLRLELIGTLESPGANADDAAGDAATDAAATEDTMNAGSSVLATMDVDLTVPGWKHINMATFLTDESFLRMTVTGGTLTGACFTTLVDVTDYNSDFTCSCDRQPCLYDLPAPDCKRLPTG